MMIQKAIETIKKPEKSLLFCDKYIGFLQMIDNDEDLKQWCKDYSAYSRPESHYSLGEYIYHDFMKDAYEYDLVVNDYRELVEKANALEWVNHPTDEQLSHLDAEQLLGCIAYHFRMDHFCEGSLVNTSIGEGYMLKMLKHYSRRINQEQQA